MNDIKDICANPDKYRKGLRDRGLDPSVIDGLIGAEKEARMATTHLQNLEAQGNIIAQVYSLEKRELSPESRERKNAELMQKLYLLREERLQLIQHEIEYFDKRVVELDRELAQWSATTKYAPVLEEICDDIRAGFHP